MTAYQWKAGSIIRADPQRVGERIESLRKVNGGQVTPEAVLADARTNKSPLHGCFEWDDSKAAQAHRLTQARYVIRSLTVLMEIVDREPVLVRAFVVVDEPQEGKEKDDQVYTSIEHAMAVPRLRAQVVTRARGEFYALRRKYAELEELRDVFTAIDHLPSMAGEEGEA